MKRLIVLTMLLVATVSTASAQRFRVGLRVGVNLTDYPLPRVSSDGSSVTGGKPKFGFETALVARLNITRHLHVQTEFEYTRTGYGFGYDGGNGHRRKVSVHANRIEIPLEIGFEAGFVRIFGGVAFRVAHNEKSTAPSLLKIRFNDSNVGIMGGVGFHIRRFFIDARVAGYPRSSITNTVTLDGTPMRVSIGRHMRYSISTGLFF